MKAVLARALGEPASLVYADVPEPEPRAGEVVVDVRAVGCNFPDILIVQGTYQKKPPLPFSPGCEVAGALVRWWMTELLAMVQTGALRPVIFKTFPLARAADALAAIGSRESYGKVVLVP